MPGINTIDKVADDVYGERLNIATDHWHCQDMDVAFINSKGFGGNNATATVFSDKVTLNMMEKRYGKAAMNAYLDKHEQVKIAQQLYREKANLGNFELIYRFGDGLVEDAEIEITTDKISLPTFTQAITLPSHNPFEDMV
jgi:acetoacetyl-[acyl-carrier protein] synthase